MACTPAWSPGLYILVVGLLEEYGFCYVTKSNTNLELKNCIRNEVAAIPMSMNRIGLCLDSSAEIREEGFHIP